MNENVVSSKKINLTKILMFAWIAIAVILVAVTIFSIISYSTYRKGQEKAIEILLETTDRFDGYRNKTLIEKMYSVLNPRYSSSYEVYETAHELDKALGRLLTEEGYDCYLGSYYLQHIGFWDYTIYQTVIPWIIWGSLTVVILILTLCIVFDSKKSMLIYQDKIICKRGKKTIKEFLVKDIKSVEFAPIKGLLVRGTGIKYRINLLKNAEELKTTIIDSITILPAESIITTTEIKSSNADELKKYKDLLDAGIITQEEFDAKKKQLLGL